MKNNPISKLSKLAMAVFAVMMISLSSCSQEDTYNLPSDSALVKLSVSASDNGVANATGDPASAIKSICILQFNANGNDFGTLRHVGKGNETVTGSGQYTATLMQSVNNEDKYKLVILANLPADKYSLLYGMVGKTYGQVQQACLSAELTGSGSIPVFDGSTPFPMFGIVDNGTPILIEANTALGRVSLVRAVARVDIGVGTKNENGTWTKGAVKFNMTQIQIWKAGKQYTYMPAANNFSSVGGTLTINIPSPTGTTETKIYGNTHITNTTYCSERIYLPEADLQWGDVYDTKHTDRLAIIVGGKYNGSQAETFYRVDFINDNPQTKMNILRNHMYQFTIKSVTDPGYATAELAYKSVPKNISFIAELVPWTVSDPVPVPPIVGYYIAYLGYNCTDLSWDNGLSIPEKRKTWFDNNNWTFDYNIFYNEANSYYSPQLFNGQNGILYHTVREAFNVEGAYPSLMVSADDLFDVQGSETVPWKTGKSLTAFDICRNYEGGGFNDWRLPRLSELALIYLNKANLERMRGFTPMRGVYWSGSEYLVGDSDADKKHSERAWTIDFNSSSPGNATNHLKTEKLNIRCVRQMN